MAGPSPFTTYTAPTASGGFFGSGSSSRSKPKKGGFFGGFDPSRMTERGRSGMTKLYGPDSSKWGQGDNDGGQGRVPFAPPAPAGGGHVTGGPQKAIEDIVTNARGEAFRLNEEEEARGAKGEKTVGDAVTAADQATMTDDTIANWMSQARDEAGTALIERMNGLRDHLGAMGINGGGVSAALASQIEVSRLAQVTDAKRSLYLEKSKSDASDRLRNFNNALALAQVQMREPSSTYLQFLGQEGSLRLGQQSIEAQLEAAKIAGKSTKDAAKEANKFNPLELIPVLGGLFA